MGTRAGDSQGRSWVNCHPVSICPGSNRSDSVVGNIFRNPKPEPLDLTIKPSQEGGLRCDEKPFLSVWGASRAGF